MAVDVATYRLDLHGQHAGTHVLRREVRGAVAELEGMIQLQGPLGATTTIQRGRTRLRRWYSLGYREETRGRDERSAFEVEFDPQAGLVTARATGGSGRSAGSAESASAPYLLPYRDPLGLLEEVRHLDAPEAPVRVPLLGKEVAVVYLGEVELDSIFGPTAARAYALHPGGARVWVRADDDRALLRMVQPLEGRTLDATLVKVAREARMPDREERRGKPSRPAKPKRRRRRRRRRDDGSS